MKKALILIGIGFLLTITMVYAWFEVEEVRSFFLQPGVFETEIRLYFDEELITATSPYYDHESHQLLVNGFDDMSPNYIGKLKVVVRVQVHNASRMRFLIQDEWILHRYYYAGYQTTVVLPNSLRQDGVNQNPYQINSIFVRRNQDAFYYYPDVIGKNEVIEVVIFDGGSPYNVRILDTYYEEVEIRFQIAVDVIQANRFVQVWKIEPDFFEED